jgi:hypothetical protein
MPDQRYKLIWGPRPAAKLAGARDAFRRICEALDATQAEFDPELDVLLLHVNVTSGTGGSFAMVARRVKAGGTGTTGE